MGCSGLLVLHRSAKHFVEEGDRLFFARAWQWQPRQGREASCGWPQKKTKGNFYTHECVSKQSEITSSRPPSTIDVISAQFSFLRKILRSILRSTLLLGSPPSLVSCRVGHTRTEPNQTTPHVTNRHRQALGSGSRTTTQTHPTASQLPSVHELPHTTPWGSCLATTTPVPVLVKWLSITCCPKQKKERGRAQKNEVRS